MSRQHTPGPWGTRGTEQQALDMALQLAGGDSGRLEWLADGRSVLVHNRPPGADVDAELRAGAVAARELAAARRRTAPS